ncbi:MAG TPA: DsrE family protein [Candidatus Methanoperedenaceae archaeon]|nr:DsrE family protein [Candidatus Methanoperedenaceae archaeon]
MKKVNIIVTQSPYGKEDAFGAIPMAATQAAVGNEPSVIFVSGGVYSVVKGQKTGYGDATVWGRDVPSVEAEMQKNMELVKFYALETDLEKRAVADGELVDGVQKLTPGQLTDMILEAEVTLVF